MRRQVLASIGLSLLLSACGGGEAPGLGSMTAPALSPTVVASPAPVATTNPAPAPAPAPAPSPTPTSTPATASSPTSPATFANRDGQTVVVAEGDSISVDYGGYYAGRFKGDHPDISYHIKAVGGSSITTLVARRSEVLGLRPDALTVFVGANDLGGYASGQAYFDALMAYIQPFRDADVKVLIATPLPRNASDNPAFNNASNNHRVELSRLLKEAVGKKIDGVIDFGGDPIVGQLSATTNGQLYSDGLHPTEISFNGAPGGHYYMVRIYDEAMKPILEKIKGQ